MLELRRNTLDEIYAHAKEEFPEECLGAILSDGEQEFVRRCKNSQNEYHAEDPKANPRDARDAYWIATDDLLKIHKEADTQNRPIKAFYHSHPNAKAYFSKKDKEDATFWDEPAYPGVVYLVISVCERQIKDLKAFSWNEETTDFEEIPVAEQVVA